MMDLGHALRPGFANRPRAGLLGILKDRLSPDLVGGSWATFRSTVIRQGSSHGKACNGLIVDKTILFVQSYK
jgi:hypothetical protein